MHKVNFICKEFYIGIAGVIVQLCLTDFTILIVTRQLKQYFQYIHDDDLLWTRNIFFRNHINEFCWSWYYVAFNVTFSSCPLKSIFELQRIQNTTLEQWQITVLYLVEFQIINICTISWWHGSIRKTNGMDLSVFIKMSSTTRIIDKTPSMKYNYT